MQGYPDLSQVTSIITGVPPSNESGFVKALNTTSTSTPLTVFAPVNSAIVRLANHTVTESLLAATLNYGSLGNTSLREILIANHIIAGAALNSTLLADEIINAPTGYHFPLNISFGITHLTTSIGLNITVAGFVTSNTRLPIPPLIMIQNSLIIVPNAIIAANGVVHLISNVIDPFIPATGGFYGPTVEITRGIHTLFAPLVKLIANYI